MFNLFHTIRSRLGRIVGRIKTVVQLVRIYPAATFFAESRAHVAAGEYVAAVKSFRKGFSAFPNIQARNEYLRFAFRDFRYQIGRNMLERELNGWRCDTKDLLRALKTATSEHDRTRLEMDSVVIGKEDTQRYLEMSKDVEEVFNTCASDPFFIDSPLTDAALAYVQEELERVFSI